VVPLETPENTVIRLDLCAGRILNIYGQKAMKKSGLKPQETWVLEA
jgi:hypothetical protein